MAARPATFNITPPRLDTAVLDRHGRQTKAAPAPNRRPLDRVNVDRYKKLTRSDVIASGDANHHVSTITAPAAAEDPPADLRVAPVAAGQCDEGQRPQQVPLLFDGKAPQVSKRREVAEVLSPADDLAPVGEVEEARQQVAVHVRLLLCGAEQRDPRADRDEDREQCGKEPSGPPQPELPQSHATGAFTFLEQAAT